MSTRDFLSRLRMNPATKGEHRLVKKLVRRERDTFWLTFV